MPSNQPRWYRRRAMILAPVVLLALVLSGALTACKGSSTVVATHHKFLILLCKATDITTVPHDLAFYTSLFLDKKKGQMNVYNYFVDQSYGSSDIDGTVIKDWVTTTRSKADLLAMKPAQGNQWRSPLAKACVDDYSATDDFKKTTKLSDFTAAGVITIWNLQDADGGATGITVDGVGYPAINAGAGARPGENSVSFFTHEMLHSLGASHARGPYPGNTSLLQFKADSDNDHTFGTSRFEEYGDCWTIMGCGEAVIWTGNDWGNAGPGVGAAHRYLMGWLPSSRVMLWSGATTKVTLAPSNRPEVAGQLLVRVPVNPASGGTCCGFYVVEYVERSGWNATLPMDHAVLIHEIRTDSPRHTYLVSRSVHGAWMPGQVFLDTANRVRISIDSYGEAATLSFSATGPGDDGKALCTPPGYRDGGANASAPSVKVESPLDGAHAVAGQPVTLQVAAFDPTLPSSTPSAERVPDSRIHWLVKGADVATGRSTTYVFSAPGDYPVEVVAQNAYCLSTTRKVTLHVDPPAAATVVILQPVEGQEILVGPPSFSATVALAGSGSSNIVTFDWIDSGPAGFVGSGSATSANIPLVSSSHNCVKEPHTITLRGATSAGEIATASVTITLVTNCIR